MSGSGHDFPSFPRPHPTRIKEWRDKRRVNILSIDGGGIRGLVPALIIEKMEEIANKRVSEMFDIIAGTSTGGILAMLCTLPESPGGKRPSFKTDGKSLVSLYTTRGVEIFPAIGSPATPDKSVMQRAFSAVHTPVRQAVGAVTTLVGGPKYAADGLEKILEEFTTSNGNPLTLSDTVVPVYVSSVEVQHPWGPIFFSSLDARIDGGKSGCNYRLSDVARATSAAPTFFAPTRFSNCVKCDDGQVKPGNVEVGCIDGGVCCNNPSMDVVNYVRSIVGSDVDINVISLGTGRTEEAYDTEKMQAWGQAQWIQPLINIMMQGTSKLAGDQMTTLAAGDNRVSHTRFQLVIPHELTASSKGSDPKVACEEMDNCTPENIGALTRFVRNVFLPEIDGSLRNSLQAVGVGSFSVSS